MTEAGTLATGEFQTATSGEHYSGIHRHLADTIRLPTDLGHSRAERGPAHACGGQKLARMRLSVRRKSA